MNQFYDLEAHKCSSCPADYPIYKDGKCLACPEGTVYHSGTGQCVSACVSNQYFSTVTNKCECPAEEPYFNGDHCFNCYGEKHYDPNTKTCEYCDIGKTWDSATSQCIWFLLLMPGFSNSFSIKKINDMNFKVLMIIIIDGDVALARIRFVSEKMIKGSEDLK